MPKSPEKKFEPKFEPKSDEKETKKEKEEKLVLVECPNYGKPIRTDIGFCHYCGTRVKEKLAESSLGKEGENE